MHGLMAFMAALILLFASLDFQFSLVWHKYSLHLTDDDYLERKNLIQNLYGFFLSPELEADSNENSTKTNSMTKNFAKITSARERAIGFFFSFSIFPRARNKKIFV
jgi:hypothetical protein